MAIMARWRMPPEILVRVLVHPLARPRARPPSHEEVLGLLQWRHRHWRRRRWVGDHRLGDLVAHGEHRVERRHGVLEDHGDVVAAHAAQLILLGQRQRASVAVGSSMDPGDAGRVLGCNRPMMPRAPSQLLPEPDSPTMAIDLAGVDVEGDATDCCLYQAVARWGNETLRSSDGQQRGVTTGVHQSACGSWGRRRLGDRHPGS